MLLLHRHNFFIVLLFLVGILVVVACSESPPAATPLVAVEQPTAASIPSPLAETSQEPTPTDSPSPTTVQPTAELPSEHVWLNPVARNPKLDNGASCGLFSLMTPTIYVNQDGTLQSRPRYGTVQGDRAELDNQAAFPISADTLSVQLPGRYEFATGARIDDGQSTFTVCSQSILDGLKHYYSATMSASGEVEIVAQLPDTPQECRQQLLSASDDSISYMCQCGTEACAESLFWHNFTAAEFDALE